MLTRGDFRFFWPENIGDFATIPSVWDSSLNTGLGIPALNSLWVTSYFNFTALFSKLGLSWNLIQLIFWVLPAILLSFFSSFYLFKTLFKFKVQYSILAGIIYTFNTYFLMILTGGQLGVSLSYSLVPLVLLGFIRLIEKLSLRNALISGLVLGFQIIFDPRIVYITLVTTFFYSVFNFSDIKRVIKNSLGFFVLPLLIAILMNIFWILPLVLTKSSPLPEGFNSVEGFKFFSFADFSHSLSLLHPNWPENIFGKTYFLKPEFLLLPIIAFSSLLFVNRQILFFSLLALVGAFLAKGTNLPFGEINIWIFQNILGMSMFRDPTKFYLLIALSYSVLIPFSIYSFTRWIISNFKLKILNTHFKFKIYYVFLLFTVFYLIFLVSPIFESIKIHQVPQEYVRLKNFLVNEKEFSRTLWIPQWQRFGYFSNNHPAIGRGEILKGDVQKQTKELRKDSTLSLLKDLSVKYIIVPYDSEGEIFLEDRKYNEKERIGIEEMLDQIPWLTKVRFNDLNHLSRIAVYEIGNFKDHFWSPSTSLRINHDFINPTEYKVQVKNAKEGNLLIFSEGFDRNWTAEISSIKYKQSLRANKLKVPSIKYNNLLNSFVLLEGDYELRIYYEPQKYVEAGLLLSLATLLASLALLLFGKRLKKW